MGKFYLYRCRINKTKPVINSFLQELKYKYKLEKYKHQLEMKPTEFQEKWHPYANLVDD